MEIIITGSLRRNRYYVITQGGFTPLHAASGKGQSDVVKTLIQNGADINLANMVWDH